MELAPAVALRAVARAAEDHGGSFEADGSAGGRLSLPVLAGLRQGWVAGRLEATPCERGTLMRFRPEEGEYRVHRLAASVLAAGAAGGLAVVVAPLWPALVPALPLGAILALAAWLFVVAGLRNSGPEELLTSLRDDPEDDEEGSGSGAAE